MIIVDVILPLPIRACFSYLFPDLMNPIIGGRVIVPFHSKDIIGLVIAVHYKESKNSLNLKFIKSIVDDQPILNSSLLNIFIWSSKYYYYPIGSIFFSILPNISKMIDVDHNNKKLFFQKNINQINLHPVNKKLFLSKKILLKINKILIKNTFRSWLISEINLYVKIKFYLGLFKKILQKNLQILIIMPYMKDIYRACFFLKQYFNVVIDVVHSCLHDKIFFNIWIKTKNGQNSIIIGTKKSIFFPFLRLGLIVVFEEHSVIYKNLDKFQCNIRDISIFRAYKENIPIILDSNTPSLKTLYNIIKKKCCWINFHQNNTALILRNRMINLKNEKIRMGLSETLINKIFENIKKNFSVLLIFNPSDLIFSGLICNHCSWIPKCDLCNNEYVVNKYNHIISCQYCLIYHRIPLFCYNCHFSPLTIFNFGIKKIKKNIKQIFPNIPLLFLINSNDVQIKKINVNMANFSILYTGIIITTEKIVQNYYFPNVRLIGLINIDYYFASCYFNNVEYFAQFYFNLVNLVKKKSKFLNIFVQTSMSNHDDLINICNKKYSFCARKILTLRKKFLLPP